MHLKLVDTVRYSTQTSCLLQILLKALRISLFITIPTIYYLLLAIRDCSLFPFRVSFQTPVCESCRVF